MKTIFLKGGKECVVDDEDFEWAGRYKWQLHPLGYAVRKFTDQTTSKEVTEKMSERVPKSEDAALGAAISIEGRLIALQERLSQQGRLRRRKTRTEARMPYADH